MVVVGAEIRKQIETFVQRAIGFGVGLVDLVQHHDGPQPEGQRLGGHELGLWHRAFGCVHQQDHTVDHRQDTLHLATEIGVAGRVDDVDPHAFPFDAGRLGEDGDPAFTLQVVTVHGPFVNGLVFAEVARLLEKLVHERRLAVVDVGDDRNVAKVHRDASKERGPGMSGFVARLHGTWGKS